MESRDTNVKKNIIYSFILKFIGMCLSFLLLPITINYLNAVEYGIWVTLFSVMNWVNMLDMGIGLGVRNKLTTALSKNDLLEAKQYISTGFFSMFVIGIIIMIIFLVGIGFIPMHLLFNTIDIDENNLFQATLLTGIFVIISFVLSLINQIYYAFQKAAVTGAINIMYNIIMLCLIYYFSLKDYHNINYFVCSFGIATVFSYMIFILYFFSNNLKFIPHFRYVKKEKIKEISCLGIQFFIIQITCVVLFSAANILITQKLGPEYVRSYDVVFKIYSVITIITTLISTPLWSAYTDAYVKGDIDWIKSTMRKLLLMLLPIGGMDLLIYIFLNDIIKLWIHVPINIPDYLSITMGLFVLTLYWLSIWNYFLNGIGEIRMQMYVSIIAAFMVFFSSWYLMGKIGVAGMPLSMAVSYLFFGIAMCYQTFYILKKWERNNR